MAAGAAQVAMKIVDYFFIIQGMVGMNMFIREEAIQTFGMGTYIGIRNENWGEVKDLLVRMDEARVESQGFVDSWGYICFPTKGAFDLYMASAKHAINMYNIVCDENIAKLKMKPVATLKVLSSPSNAAISIRGLETGRFTPATFYNLPPIKTRIELERYDPTTGEFMTAKRTITLEDWQRREILIILPSPKDKKEPTAKLIIASSPTYAEISLNGQPTGKLTPETFDGLKPGVYKIDVRKFDPDTKAWVSDYRGVTLGPWEEERVKFELGEPLAGVVASLGVTSSPADAKIFFDNVYLNLLTPETIKNITPGEHMVKLEKLDRVTEELWTAKEDVTLEAGEKKEIRLILKPPEKPPEVEIPEPAKLGITSFPSGADIILNDYFIGLKTPETIKELNPGKYRIRLERLDPRTEIKWVAVEDIELEAGEKREITMYLKPSEPLPETPESPDVATLGIYSSPTKAGIIIDNTVTGLLTPETFKDITPGRHKISLVYRDPITGLLGVAEQTVTLEKNDRKEIRLLLRFPPSVEVATLTIKSSPTNANIILNDKNTEHLTPETFKRIVPGHYEIKVWGINLIENELLIAKDEIDLETGDLKEIIMPFVKPTATLSISSIPGLANIYIDGIEIGLRTPSVIDIAPGAHVVLLTFYDTENKVYKEAVIEVELKHEEYKEIELELIESEG